MLFLSFHSLYVLLTVILLVRVLLNNSNFATLFTVALTSFLSFVFFGSFWALLPLVSYFLRDYLVFLFAWLKTFFFNLKDSLFFRNKEEEKENVLLMKGKRRKSPYPRREP